MQPAITSKEKMFQTYSMTEKKQERPEALSKYYWGIWGCTCAEDCRKCLPMPHNTVQQYQTSQPLNMRKAKHLSHLCVITNPIPSHP